MKVPAWETSMDLDRFEEQVRRIDIAGVELVDVIKREKPFKEHSYVFQMISRRRNSAFETRKRRLWKVVCEFLEMATHENTHELMYSTAMDVNVRKRSTFQFKVRPMSNKKGVWEQLHRH